MPTEAVERNDGETFSDAEVMCGGALRGSTGLSASSKALVPVSGGVDGVGSAGEKTKYD